VCAPRLRDKRTQSGGRSSSWAACSKQLFPGSSPLPAFSSPLLQSAVRGLSWGAGPRAGLNLILAAKARAILNGQTYVSCDDVAAVAPPVLRHRIVANFDYFRCRHSGLAGLLRCPTLFLKRSETVRVRTDPDDKLSLNVIHRKNIIRAARRFIDNPARRLSEMTLYDRSGKISIMANRSRRILFLIHAFYLPRVLLLGTAPHPARVNP